jgi:hypothetical protein
MRLQIFIIFLLALSCKSENAPEKHTTPASVSPAVTEDQSNLDYIQLPEGYNISIFAEDVENARSLCLSPNGV